MKKTVATINQMKEYPGMVPLDDLTSREDEKARELARDRIKTGYWVKIDDDRWLGSGSYTGPVEAGA